MDIDLEWGGIPKPRLGLPGGVYKARKSGEAEVVRREYANHYKIKFFGPSPMKNS